MWAAGGGLGGVSGSAAVSVLREVFTRCDSNILGTSGCTGDSLLSEFLGLLIPKVLLILVMFPGKQQRILFVLSFVKKKLNRGNLSIFNEVVSN